MKLAFDRMTAYAVTALNYLVHVKSATGRGEAIQAARIASDCAIPDATARKVLIRLGRSGLVKGTQGAGYVLTEKGRGASVLDVARALDGAELSRAGCFMKEGPCSMEESCDARAVCREMRSLLVERLGSLRIASLPVDAKGIPVCLREEAA